MSPEMIGLIGIIIMMVLIFANVPLGAGMALVGFVGFGFITSFDKGLSLFALTSFSTLSDFNLAVIPLFILMGQLASVGGLSDEAFYAANKWIGHLRGGLAMAAVGGCAGFAAVCGSAVATAATMCSAALPEMRKYKYADELSLGTIGCGGLLGFMIPPSIPFLIYAFLTQESVGSLFIAGIFPGILIAALFVLAIYTRCKIDSTMCSTAPNSSWKDKGKAFLDIWAVLVLFILVMGGIYTGVFTAIEAGAIGAFAALILGVIKKRINFKVFGRALLGAAELTGMIFLLIVGAAIFNGFIAITQIPFSLAEYVGGLSVPPIFIVAIFMLMYIILGFVMDIMAVMMLSIPIIYPILQTLGIDPIWFGVLTVLTVMIGNITPPLGIVIFTIGGIVKDVPMGTIFKGVWPFFAAMVVAVIIILVFPDVATWLPSQMTPG